MSIKGLAERLLDLVLPPRCPVTGEIVDKTGGLSPLAWRELRFIADPRCSCCGYPFDIDTSQDQEDNGPLLCAECIADPPPFEKARSALIYDEGSKSLVRGFKYADKMEHARCMVPWLQLAGADLFSHADILIPVPLYRWRLFHRRYNQSAILAQGLKKVTGIPCCEDALLRHRHTAIQASLPATEREGNVKGAFDIHPRRRDKIEGRSVILIDDVYTTGATARECARILLSSGASKIFLLTVARTLNPRIAG